MRRAVRAAAQPVPADQVMGEVVAQVVADKEIQLAVPVVIDPGRARAPVASVPDPSGARHVAKATAALVMKEPPRFEAAAHVQVVRPTFAKSPAPTPLPYH